MTKKEKQLLLIDLCARLPYGVICYTEKGDGYFCSINQTIFGTEYGLSINPLKRDYFNDSETEEQVIKPYLRPMSSMTEEEEKVFNDFLEFQAEYVSDADLYNKTDMYDWLLANHFDYRIDPSTGKTLIESGLALEAPEGMYKTE